MCNASQRYAVFIDIDGTLMGSNEAALKQNISTIQKVRSLGHKVFISTGRGKAYLPETLDYDKNFDGIITGAGTVARMGGKSVVSRLMPYSVTEKFCRFAFENGINGVIEGERNMFYFGKNDDVDSAWVEGIEDSWLEINAENFSSTLLPDEPIEKYTVLGEIPKEMDEVLSDDCVVLRFSYYGEIIQKSCGKGTALKEMAEILDIPIEYTVAIGDSMNDYDMIKAAGIGVAMGNATEKIKEISDFVTETADAAGVSVALSKIFDL